ncbi:ABC-F family ATP-binding cassette domain-containing protein [Desulfocurvibacter africanus]|uniref:ABC transporter related protein n=1 Tax=Desulfocurvibacter africanus subsp. africanus str. Walvis Bay TaxID=690850 RepID=F3YV80_DESAF|nr:ABC-F family ATP-binding cassette domain-containing protein [Desulfocurvibacter africanus]EGJ48398.1 ABC transporter related protein [Desulfocurvibacter africanus subsp. africanus str. Walvis Bay]
MSILTLVDVTKSYAGHDLFSGICLEVDHGERVAVVGPNGCGKSTLLRAITGDVEPDSGKIKIAQGARVGYAAQELGDLDLESGLLSWVLEALPSWADFWHEWEQAAQSGDKNKLEKLAARQAHLEQTFGYNPEHKAGAILLGLGFAMEQFEQPMRRLSGGWRERAKLARVLLAGADLLILDEPTNHLDLEAVEWLEQFLLAFQGALIFVVHERTFLDNVASHVLFLGGSKPVVKKGNFTSFLEWFVENEKHKERQAAKISARIEHNLDYVRRFRAQARKASQAQSKLKQAERLRGELDDFTLEKRRKTLSFTLPKPDRSDKVVAHAKDLEFAFPGKPALWPALTFDIFRGQSIALAGPNGAGKSTLLKLMVGELHPNKGQVLLGPSTRMAYFSQHQAEVLVGSNTVRAELRRLLDPRTTEEELCGVLGLFLLGEDYFDRPVSKLSGGEKSRLALASLFMNRANFIVMDEPTNHLDMESREGLIEALNGYEGTLLLVAHDRFLLTEAVDEVWAVGPEGLRVFENGFGEYDDWRRAEAVRAAQAGPAGVILEPGRRRPDKEERRRRAEIRNAVSKELAPKKEAYARVERELESIMARQTELETLLADPATYSKTEEFVRLTSEYKQAKEREEQLFMDFSSLEESITELERRRDELLAEE